MFAPSYTLLINTGKVLARIDLVGKRQPRVQRFWTRASIDTTSLAAMATAALKLGPRRAGRVWVLSADFWTELLSLPADITALLGGNELLQALALEAEADSGISAFASQVGAQHKNPLGDEGRWWVTQVSTAELQQLAQALAQCGARLAGVAHLAAARLTQPATAGSSPSALQPLADLEEFSLQSWREHSPAMTLEVDAPELDVEAAWQQLADEWARLLTQRPRPALMLAVDRAPLSHRQQLAVSAALALLSLGLCGSWHWRTQQRIDLAERGIAVLEEQQTAQTATLSSLKSCEARLSQVRQAVTQAQAERERLQRDLNTANAMHAQQSLRWIALMDALADSTDSDCWVRRLESKPSQAVLSGLAVDNAAAHRFASRLERLLRSSGWEVLPAETKLGQRELVGFQIVLIAENSPVKLDDASSVSRWQPMRPLDRAVVLRQRAERLR